MQGGGVQLEIWMVRVQEGLVLRDASPPRLQVQVSRELAVSLHVGAQHLGGRLVGGEEGLVLSTLSPAGLPQLYDGSVRLQGGPGEVEGRMVRGEEVLVLQEQPTHRVSC